MEERDRIEKIMQKVNLNSTQFAMETGIQTSTLSHILNGRNKVSLDVLKKILNRYHNISSDWLILGVGPMLRQEEHSQTPIWPDLESENDSQSVISASELTLDFDASETSNQEKRAFHQEKVFNYPQAYAEPSPAREVKKIIVYYSDNSFQEFTAD